MLAADGSFIYTPPADANGTATFDYTLTDGHETVTAAATIEVVAVNDPPDFSLAANPSWPAGTVGMQSLPGFATITSFGASNESDQHVAAWTVRTVGDADGVASNVAIALDGTLTYTLSGHSGIATFAAKIRDDGGTANGGNDTSVERSFTIQVAVGTDLSITIDDGQQFAQGGMPVAYSIVVHNSGSRDVAGARVESVLPGNLTDATWTCTAGFGASCTAEGSGAIDDTVHLPSGGGVTYVLTATVLAEPEQPLENTVMVTAPAGVPDVNPANDSSTDVDAVGVFADGFDEEHVGTDG